MMVLSLDHFGDAEEVLIRIRSIRQRLIMRQGLA